jgi:hypothetical protein
MAVAASVLDMLKYVVAFLENENTFFIIERFIHISREIWVLGHGYIGTLREVSEKSPLYGDYLGVFNKVPRMFYSTRKYETIIPITSFSHIGYASVEDRAM